MIVVVGHCAASVRAALRGAAANIIYREQAQPAGTADAVCHAADLLDGDFLVVAGDVVTAPANIAILLDRFAQDRPLAAALVHPLGQEPPQNWLIAHVKNEQLRAVEGHARGGDYRLGGVYAFAGQALRNGP